MPGAPGTEVTIICCIYTCVPSHSQWLDLTETVSWAAVSPGPNIGQGFLTSLLMWGRLGGDLSENNVFECKKQNK